MDAELAGKTQGVLELVDLLLNRIRLQEVAAHVNGQELQLILLQQVAVIAGVFLVQMADTDFNAVVPHFLHRGQDGLDIFLDMIAENDGLAGNFIHVGSLLKG